MVTSGSRISLVFSEIVGESAFSASETILSSTSGGCLITRGFGSSLEMKFLL